MTSLQDGYSMLVFNIRTMKISDITRLEEKVDGDLFITDQEHDKLQETINAGLGDLNHIWVEGKDVKSSGAPPSEVHVFDLNTKQWVIDQELNNSKLIKERDEKISQLSESADDLSRDLEISLNINGEEVVFNSTSDSLIIYLLLASRLKGRSIKLPGKVDFNVSSEVFEMLLDKVVDKYIDIMDKLNDQVKEVYNLEDNSS